MSLTTGEVGLTLIGPPGSGKTTLSNLVGPMIGWHVHDHDNDGMENARYGLGKGGIEKKIKEVGDRAFLQWERDFTLSKYGNLDEGKVFSLDNTIFASSGSLVRSRKAMEHISARTHVILLDIPLEVVLQNIQSRPGGAGRIIGMNGGPNGETPMSASLEEELRSRYTLYRTSSDSRLIYQKGENPQETAERLKNHIIRNIL